MSIFVFVFNDRDLDFLNNIRRSSFVREMMRRGGQNDELPEIKHKHLLCLQKDKVLLAKC